MIQAGLIDAIVSPLYDQDKEVRLDAIDFAARMAFDGTATPTDMSYNSSMKTDEIRGMIDWRECIEFVQQGVRNDNQAIQHGSWTCAERFVAQSMLLSYWLGSLCNEIISGQLRHIMLQSDFIESSFSAPQRAYGSIRALLKKMLQSKHCSWNAFQIMCDDASRQ